MCWWTKWECFLKGQQKHNHFIHESSRLWHKKPKTLQFKLYIINILLWTEKLGWHVSNSHTYMHTHTHLVLRHCKQHGEQSPILHWKKTELNPNLSQICENISSHPLIAIRHRSGIRPRRRKVEQLPRWSLTSYVKHIWHEVFAFAHFF